MSLVRRPRIKPTAILKPRRPTLQDQNVPDPESSSSTIIASQDYSIVDNSIESNDTSTKCNENKIIASQDYSIVDNSIESTNTSTKCNEIIPKTEFIAASEQINSTDRLLDEKPKFTQPRRLIKPTIVLPGARKKPQTPVIVAVSETNTTNHVDNTIIDQKPDIKPILSSVCDNFSIGSPLSAIPYEKPSDDYFKSPYMSPSMHNNNNNNNQQTPGCSSIVDDIVAPSSPAAKIRQRIRPTPCFNRRNSIQGTNSDFDDDISTANRRQRHLSTSSSHSAHHNQNNKLSSSQIGRIRTESTCSNVSDIISTAARSSTALKSKKSSSSTRSDGLSKVSTARRDFTHRFNGQTPDKTRLTMFDMIYYNPITNPMKNPAPKSSEVRDRRSSVCSVASIKSVESAKSMAKPAINITEPNVIVKQEV